MGILSLGSIYKDKDPLDNVLYTVPGTNTNISWADSVEGTLIMGATGSGKSSGAGQFIARKMLKQGFGFCVLCVKKDEKDRWVQYANETGRKDDLIVFNKESKFEFNFLSYEMNREGEGAGDVLNVSNLLISINEQIRILQSGSSQGDEKFWDNSLKRLISRTVSLLKITKEEVTIYNIRRIIAESLTRDNIQVYDLLKDTIDTTEKIPKQEKEKAREQLAHMANSNYFVKLLEKTSHIHYSVELITTIQYWKNEFASLSEKTRSIIVESVLAIIEPFLVDGILKNKFSKGVSPELLPENIIKNKKIVIIDFSLKEYGLSGLVAIIIYKISFQFSMERREIDKETDPKPVGFWVDEYQSLCYPSLDAQFQATARSSWVATVYITQNLNGIYQVMGTHQAQARAKALLGNMNLKFFASNADFDTNEWASKMIGSHWVSIDTLNYSNDMELSKTQRPERRPKVEIEEFTTLKTGRRDNNFIIGSIVFKAGKTWGEEKQNYALVEFKQKTT